MSLKSEVYGFMNSQDSISEITAKQWTEFQRNYVQGLRLKYNNDGTVLLNFQGRGRWYEPEEFYQEYRDIQNCKFEESLGFMVSYDPARLYNHLWNNLSVEDAEEYLINLSKGKFDKDQTAKLLETIFDKLVGIG